MKIYHYHPITKELLEMGVADESPLELDVFLIPAHATEIEPPHIDEKQAAIFTENGWQVVADYRKDSVCKIDIDGFFVAVHKMELGEELNQNLILSAPPPEGLYKPKWNGTKWVQGAEPSPPEPTEIEILQEKVAMQDMVIEELMFIIIPELTGGGI